MNAWHCDPPSWKSYFLALVAKALLQELASEPSLEVGQDEDVSLGLTLDLQSHTGVSAGGVRGVQVSHREACTRTGQPQLL